MAGNQKWRSLCQRKHSRTAELLQSISGRHKTVERIRLLAVFVFAEALVGTLSAFSPMPVLAGILAVFPILVSLQSPVTALLLTIVSLPLDDVLVVDIGFTVRPAMVLSLVATGVWLASKQRAHFGRSPIDRALFLFWLVNGISIFQTVFLPTGAGLAHEVAGFRAGATRSAVQFGLLTWMMFFFFFLTYSLCSNKETLIKAIRVLITATIAVSCYGIYQIAGLTFNLPLATLSASASTRTDSAGVYMPIVTGFGFARVQSTFTEPLFFANFLLTVLPLMIALRANRRSESLYGRRFLTVGVASAGLALMVAESRGGWVGFLVSLVVLLWGSKRGRRRWSRYTPVLLVITLVALSGLLILSVLGQLGLLSRVGDLIHALSWEMDSNLDPTFELGRAYHINFALEVFQKYPILGIGLGNFPLYVIGEFSIARLLSAQGIFWLALAETGLIGFLSLLWLLGKYFAALIRALRLYSNSVWHPHILGCTAAMAGVLAQYLTFGDRFSQWIWFLVGLSMAVVYVARAEGTDTVEETGH